MQTNWMNPSGMSQVLGACDPAILVDRNFALISNVYGLNLPALTSLDSDTISEALQQNFDATAAALHLNLYPVDGSADPEAATQANFEIINLTWFRRGVGGNPATPGDSDA